jgi:LysR family transcriptional activator of glutamate synthase operon
MELKQLRYFMALVKYEHVSKTADFLNIAQPTLSKSLHTLERELGTPLFDRIGNRIRLNANGRRFREYAEKSLQYLDAGILDVKNTIYDITDRITVDCWCFAPIIWPCVAEYQRLNPLTEFMLLQSSLGQMGSLSDHEADFILRSSANEDAVSDSSSGQFWVSQTLFEEQMFLVMGPAFPAFNDLPVDTDTIDLSLLQDAPFITMRVNTAFINDITYQICQNAGFWPRILFQTDDFLLKMHIVRSGSAVAILPNACLDDARMLCPGLKILKIKNYESFRRIRLLRKRKMLLTEAAQDFWNFVLDYYNLPADERD